MVFTPQMSVLTRFRQSTTLYVVAGLVVRPIRAGAGGRSLMAASSAISSAADSSAVAAAASAVGVSVPAAEPSPSAEGEAELLPAPPSDEPLSDGETRSDGSR